MTEPTDADRAKAAELLNGTGAYGGARTQAEDRIAAALAAERAAAVADLRARVEAVVEEVRRHWVVNTATAWSATAAGVAPTVRRASPSTSLPTSAPPSTDALAADDRTDQS